MKSLLLLMLIGDMTSGQHTTKRDITSEVDVYASLRPFSMMACMVQCGQSPVCNSVLLEEKTKTCFLNGKVTKGPFVGISGYKYSEKADPTKPERVQQCSVNVKKEFEACSKNRNGITPATTDATPTTSTTSGTPTTTTTAGTTSATTTSGTTTTTTTSGTTTLVTTKSSTTTATTTPDTTSDTTPVTTTTMTTSGTTTPSTTTSEMPTSEMTSPIIDTTTEASVIYTSQKPCPNQYIAISSFDPPICCRIETTNPANFLDAEAICQTEGSTFILPDSLERLDAVNEAIFTAAMGTTTPHMVWMGGSRGSHDVSWKTADDGLFDYDTFLLSKWDPSNTNEGNCVGVLFTPPRNMSGWLATNCSTQAWFVCTPTTASPDYAYSYLYP